MPSFFNNEGMLKCFLLGVLDRDVQAGLGLICFYLLSTIGGRGIVGLDSIFLVMSSKRIFLYSYFYCLHKR